MQKEAIPKECNEPTVAHVDMDCFFAGCEEKRNPHLKNVPLGVGALPTDKRGVLCTANYPARKYGLRSAMPISKALQLCPHGVFLRPDMQYYRRESAEVMHILRAVADRFEQVSVDEAYLDVTSLVTVHGATKAGEFIRRIVLEITGLSCSVGIAHSRYVAKIASDEHKPGGVTIVGNAREYLASKPIQSISGIGKVSAAYLRSNNIITISDLANAPIFHLMDILGKSALHFQTIARGEDQTGVNDIYQPSQSISKESTFMEDISYEDCINLIPEFSQEVINDMYTQSAHFMYKTVSIKVRFSDFTTLTRDITVPFACNDIQTVINASTKLMAKISREKPIRLFGIKVSNLVLVKEQQTQLNSFSKVGCAV